MVTVLARIRHGPEHIQPVVAFQAVLQKPLHGEKSQFHVSLVLLQLGRCHNPLPGVQEIDPVLFRLFPDLLRAHAAPDQVQEPGLAENRHGIAVVPCKFINTPPLPDLLVQPFRRFFQNSAQLLQVHRLQDVLGHIEPDRLLRVLELIEAGKDEKLDVGISLPDPFAELQSVHVGHADVRQQDVRCEMLHFFQRVLSVLRVADLAVPQALPVQLFQDGAAHLFLIIHQHDPVFSHGFLPAVRRRRVFP